MTWNMRPLSVTILAWLYIGVGMIGFVSHFTEIHARNALPARCLRMGTYGRQHEQHC